MSHTTFYVQSCPACGRKARILLDYLGRQVGCRHCGREFTAAEPESTAACENAQPRIRVPSMNDDNSEIETFSTELHRNPR